MSSVEIAAPRTKFEEQQQAHDYGFGRGSPINDFAKGAWYDTRHMFSEEFQEYDQENLAPFIVDFLMGQQGNVADDSPSAKFRDQTRAQTFGNIQSGYDSEASRIRNNEKRHFGIETEGGAWKQSFERMRAEQNRMVHLTKAAELENRDTFTDPQTGILYKRTTEEDLAANPAAADYGRKAGQWVAAPTRMGDDGTMIGQKEAGWPALPSTELVRKLKESPELMMQVVNDNPIIAKAYYNYLQGQGIDTSKMHDGSFEERLQMALQAEAQGKIGGLPRGFVVGKWANPAYLVGGTGVIRGGAAATKLIAKNPQARASINRGADTLNTAFGLNRGNIGINAAAVGGAATTIDPTASKDEQQLQSFYGSMASGAIAGLAQNFAGWLVKKSIGAAGNAAKEWGEAAGKSISPQQATEEMVAGMQDYVRGLTQAAQNAGLNQRETDQAVADGMAFVFGVNRDLPDTLRNSPPWLQTKIREMLKKAQITTDGLLHKNMDQLAAARKTAPDLQEGTAKNINTIRDQQPAAVAYNEFLGSNANAHSVVTKEAMDGILRRARENGVNVNPNVTGSRFGRKEGMSDFDNRALTNARQIQGAIDDDKVPGGQKMRARFSYLLGLKQEIGERLQAQGTDKGALKRLQDDVQLMIDDALKTEGSAAFAKVNKDYQAHTNDWRTINKIVGEIAGGRAEKADEDAVKKLITDNPERFMRVLDAVDVKTRNAIMRRAIGANAIGKINKGDLAGAINLNTDLPARVLSPNMSADDLAKAMKYNEEILPAKNKAMREFKVRAVLSEAAHRVSNNRSGRERLEGFYGMFSAISSGAKSGGKHGEAARARKTIDDVMGKGYVDGMARLHKMQTTAAKEYGLNEPVHSSNPIVWAFDASRRSGVSVGSAVNSFYHAIFRRIGPFFVGLKVGSNFIEGMSKNEIARKLPILAEDMQRRYQEVFAEKLANGEITPNQVASALVDARDPNFHAKSADEVVQNKAMKLLKTVTDAEVQNWINTHFKGTRLQHLDMATGGGVSRQQIPDLQETQEFFIQEEEK